MFQQFLADGGNLFIAIVAVIIGFAAAMGYTDYQRTKDKEKKQH